MGDKNILKSDAGIGVELEVKKNNARSNRIGFSSNLFSVGEKVRVMSQEQYNELIDELLKIDDYKSKNSSANTSSAKEKDDVIKDLKLKIKSLEKSIEDTNNSLSEYQTTNENLVKDKESLETEIAKLKKNNNSKLPLDFEKRESELKETIKNQQSHISELTKKIESLTSLKEYISPKQHYEEIDALKDKIKDVEKELDKNNAEVETKLAIQKSDFETKLASQKSDLEISHNNNKAQMLVAYTQEIDNYKLKYNELAKDYNHLLGDASSLSRLNTLFNARHKSIIKDKEPVQLEEIKIEKDSIETIEYVPKKENTQ